MYQIRFFQAELLKFKHVCFLYLDGISFRYKLIGFGPVVYLVMKIGRHIFRTNIAVVIIIMSSLDTPASISFKFVTDSDVDNPI